MPTKNIFFTKVNLLMKVIRENGGLSMGEACKLLGVGAWSIRTNYGPVLNDLSEDIVWNGKHFECHPIKPKTTTASKLDGFIVQGLVQPVKKEEPSHVRRLLTTKSG